MFAKLSDVFKQTHLTNFELWEVNINDRFIVVIWVSSGAFCKPKKSGLPLDSYTEVEMDLYHCNPNGEWGSRIFNSEVKKMGLDFLGTRGSHFHNLPIDMLLVAMNQLDSIGKLKVEAKILAKVPEAKCKHCGRMNDIGVAECWHCTVRNPTGEDDKTK